MSCNELEKICFSRMQSGDPGAFEYFFKMHADALFTYAVGFCQDHQMADDVVQEVFVRFWIMREKITYSESIYGYLQRMVRNICVNHKVHASVRDKYRQEVLHTEEEAFHWEDDDAIEELRKQLLEAIDRLPEKCREIFIESCIEGLKYQEVADKLGITINTVKTQVRFAYKKLRNDLQVSDKGIITLLLFLLK